MRVDVTHTSLADRHDTHATNEHTTQEGVGFPTGNPTPSPNC